MSSRAFAHADAPAMPDSPEPARHVKPYVHESQNTRALHFSLDEIQSRMRIADPHALDLEYTRTMMAFLLFVPEPQDIVMIGLGGGSLAKFCHRQLKTSRIQVVEINPHVIALRDAFQVPPDDERFAVVAGDGAQFVRRGASRCDVLLVDGFDSDGLPSRLCSQRFYDDCHALLQPQGIMVANLHSRHARFDIFVDRMRRSFDDAVFVVGDAERSNSIVFAAKGQAFDRLRPGAVRRPKSLDAAAAEPLLGGFARVMSALDERRRRRLVNRMA